MVGFLGIVWREEDGAGGGRVYIVVIMAQVMFRAKEDL